MKVLKDIKLPKNWNIVELSKLVAENIRYPIGDGDHGQIKPEHYQSEGIPYIRVADIVDDRINNEKLVYISQEIHNKNKKGELHPGDVIIAKTGATIGKVAIIPEDIPIANTTASIGKITLDLSKILSKYLLLYLKTPYFRNQMFRVSHKSAQAGFNIDDMKNFEIIIPPIEEQQRIVDILERCESAMQKSKEANRLTDEFLKSTFLEMFGDTVRNPKGWPIKPLEMVSITRGQYGSGAAGTTYDPRKPRYVRITDINEDGTLNNDRVSPGTDASEWSEYMLHEGDVLFARSGATVGKTYRYREVDGSCVFAGYLIRFKPNTIMILPDYLFYFTKSSAYKAWVESKKKVVAQPNINAKQYGTELLITLPPIPKQKKFADVVQKVEKLKVKQRESKKQLSNLFHSLMQRAFRGDFDIL